MVIDQPELFEAANAQHRAHSSYPKHGGEEILGYGDVQAAAPIGTNQKPFRQSLFDVVLCVTSRGLGQLGHLSLNDA